MPKDITTHIHDPERAAAFRNILGTDQVTICSPIPSWSILPERGEELVYFLDLDSITAEQRGRLVSYLAGRFGLAEEYVAATLDVHGVPILAEHVTVSVANPWRWLDIDLDLDEDDDWWDDEFSADDGRN